MRVFVTGGTGFIGGHVIERLVQRADDVVALVRDEDAPAAISLEAMGCRLVPGDITHPATLRPGMRGADAVIHLAAWYKVGAKDSRMAERINVTGTENVLSAMQEEGIERGVYTSTLAIHSDTKGQLVDESYVFAGKHLSEYDRTKALAHERAQAFIDDGLPLTIVQPGVVYGPGDPSAIGQMLRAYLAGKLPLAPDMQVCWAHVEDTADGILLALDKGRIGASYHLSGEPHAIIDVLAMAEEITGIPAPRKAPRWLIRSMAAVMRPVAAIAPVRGDYHPETLRVAAGATYLGSNHKARKELGFDPRPLRLGLEQTLAKEQAAMAEPPVRRGG